MSKNRLCNNCISPQYSQGGQASDQINYEHVLGWFKRLDLGVQNDLLRELSSKVQGTSIDKLPSETEENFRLRKFNELFNKYPSNSQKAFGTKVLKAYAHGLSHLSLKRQACSSADEEYNFLNKPELFKVKSLDHLKRGGSQNGQECLKQVCVADEGSSLKLDLFKIRTLLIRGGTHGGQGSSDEQIQQ